MTDADALLTAGLVAYFRLMRPQLIAAAINEWTERKKDDLKKAFCLVISSANDDFEFDKASALVPRWKDVFRGDCHTALSLLLGYRRVRDAFTNLKDKTLSKIIAGLSPLVPDQDRYEPDEMVLEVSGHGDVRLAQDNELCREVVFKQPKSDLADDPLYMRRFLFECHVTALLEHPGIATVYGMGMHEGRPYYTMRRIKGKTLDEIIKSFHDNKSFASRSTQNIQFHGLLRKFVTICEIVTFAHSKNVIHRDLKPTNIMHGEYGETVVLDWGCAKQKTPPSLIDRTNETVQPSIIGGSEIGALTLAGTAVGTHGYRSPEIVSGEPYAELPEQMDVYSLGAILYYLLTDKQPEDVVESTSSEGVPSWRKIGAPRSKNGRISPVLDAICEKATSLSKANRYRSVKDLKDDIDRWLIDEPVSCHTPLRVRIGRRIRRNSTWLLILFATLLAVTVVSYVWNNAVRERDEKLLIAQERRNVEAISRREELMISLKAGDHSQATRNLATIVADDFPEDPAVHLIPAVFSLIDARTSEQHAAVPDTIRKSLNSKIAPNQDRYVTLFDRFAEFHLLLVQLIELSGGLNPKQWERMDVAEKQLLKLFKEEPELAEVADKIPTLRRLILTINVLNRTYRAKKALSPPFDEMAKVQHWNYWQAEEMEKADKKEWGAELHYQLAANHFANIFPLINLDIPKWRKDQLGNDPKRIEQEISDRLNKMGHELTLMADSANRAYTSTTTHFTPTLVDGPLVRIKSRMLEAYALILLMRFDPKFDLEIFDRARHSLATIRDGTTDAPADAQLYSRASTLLMISNPLTTDQRLFWAGNPHGYRERMERLNVLGWALLQEWEGAEAIIWGKKPNAWDSNLQTRLFITMMDAERFGLKVPSINWASPVTASKSIRAALAGRLEELDNTNREPSKK
jgi:serine/threonine protein kinase